MQPQPKELLIKKYAFSVIAALVFVGAASAAAPPQAPPLNVPAQAPPIEERVSALEKQVAELQRQLFAMEVRGAKTTQAEAPGRPQGTGWQYNSERNVWWKYVDEPVQQAGYSSSCPGGNCAIPSSSSGADAYSGSCQGGNCQPSSSSRGLFRRR